MPKADTTPRVMLCGHTWYGAGVRGVCPKCYSMYGWQINQRLTTWKKLENAGLVNRLSAAKRRANARRLKTMRGEEYD